MNKAKKSPSSSQSTAATTTPFANEPLDKILRTLKLSGISKGWQEVQYKGDAESYIRELLTLEIEEREVNRINRMIKAAGFGATKTLADFIWKPTIEIPRGITQEEIEGASFIPKKENLIFMGAVGTGKTHLASAIALSLCESGKQVRFYTAAYLANLLLEKNRKNMLNNFIDSLKRVELIVIDEIGFVPLHKEAAELLFQVISDCYERKSLIITTNLEFSGWNSIFGDNRLTTALIDRLIHHSHILIFTGESHRLQESMRRQKARS